MSEYETRWDQDAKRRRDESRQAEADAHEATGIRQQCARLYLEEEEKRIRQAKRKAGITPQQIMASFSRLYGEVDKRTKDKPLLAEWRHTTLMSLEDAMGHCVAAQLGTDANFIREIPIQGALVGSQDAKPIRVAAFRSEAEFEAIDFVRAWSDQPDHVGFLLDAPRAVLSLTRDGEVHLVGHVGSQKYLSYPPANRLAKEVQGGKL